MSVHRQMMGMNSVGGRNVMWQTVVSGIAAATMSCSPPLTDIMATSTEDVGDYEIVEQASTDDTLTATVCVARPPNAHTVAQRIIQQLLNHGFGTMKLDIVAQQPNGQSENTHVIWTAHNGFRVIGRDRAPKNRCRVKLE